MVLDKNNKHKNSILCGGNNDILTVLKKWYIFYALFVYQFDAKLIQLYIFMVYCE